METEKEITGLSQIVKERAKAKAPSLPIDLIQRSVKTEAPERQELHKLQRLNVPSKMRYKGWKNLGKCHRYYLFVDDDLGCLIEQEDEEGNVQHVKDTDTDQILPTDQITEAKVEMYKMPEEDQQEDNTETISSTSMADYD